MSSDRQVELAGPDAQADVEGIEAADPVPSAGEGAALKAGDLTYPYLEVPDTAGFADVGAIMQASPEDVRRAAVRLVRDNESSSLIVRFELPNVSYKHDPESL